MNSIFLDLGFFQVTWYSILILIGILIAGIIIFKESKRFNINKDFITNLIFWMIIFGIIGARLYFVAFDWSYYSSNITSIFKIWEGGLAIHGGIISALIFLIIYTKKYKLKPILLTDIMVVGLIIGQAVGRWGNFFNQEAHGGAVSRTVLENLHIPNFIIDGMNIYGTYYHPTFLYESLWCLLGFIILLLIRKYKYLKLGQLTGLYFMWYSVGRFFIESLRTDSLMLFNFKFAQIISIILFIVGFILMIKNLNGSKFQNLYIESGEKADGIKF
ncbi:MAG: prolipoprotein diacylglyceryl transferase [Bacilli bacterium]|nr:prolipoprotein diacylglyceryl transferase [Bacilli bacterium]